MRRRTFDLLASMTGLLLAIVLAVAGGLLIWAYSFVGSQVHDQLAAQKIYFPAASSAEIKALPAADAAAMKQYAGQLMTNGAQAETYANHFIAVHLRKIGGGKTYAQLSAESLAHPGNAKLAAQVETVFKGTTLRGAVAERLRVLADGADRTDSGDRIVRRGRSPADLVWAGVLALAPRPRRGRVAERRAVGMTAGTGTAGAGQRDSR